MIFLNAVTGAPAVKMAASGAPVSAYLTAPELPQKRRSVSASAPALLADISPGFESASRAGLISRQGK